MQETVQYKACWISRRNLPSLGIFRDTYAEALQDVMDRMKGAPHDKEYWIEKHVKTVEKMVVDNNVGSIEHTLADVQVEV